MSRSGRSIFFIGTITFAIQATPALAQQARNSCDAYSGGSIFPSQCLMANSATTTTTNIVTIENIEHASYAHPMQTRIPPGKTFVGYDLQFDNLCGDHSLNAAVTDWVGGKLGSFQILENDKSVAMTAVVTFPDAKKDETKQIKIPLIVKANFGDANVQNCDTKMFTDIPANRRVNLHFEFKRKSVLSFPDKSSFTGGVLKIAQGAASLGAWGGSHVFAPAITGLAVSFLQKDTDAVKTITAGMNDILASFADQSNPDPTQYPIEPNSDKLTYKHARKVVFTVSKNIRISMMTVNPARGWPPVYSDFSSTFSALQTLYTNAQTAVDSPWAAHMDKFCDKLRLQVNSATGGDRVGTALGIGFHAFQNSTEYKPGATCLNKWEISTLTELGYAPPFTDAWDVQVVTTPPKTKGAPKSATKNPTAQVKSAAAGNKHQSKTLASAYQ